MKVLKVIKKIIIGIFIAVFFCFAILMTVLLLNRNKYKVTQFGDTTLVVLNSKVSSEKYKKGDLILVDSIKVEDIQVGDELFAYQLDSEKNATIDFGTVGNVSVEQKAVEFENGSTYAMEFVVGKSSKVYSNIGLVLSVVQSQWGFLFIILVPCFLIFVYEVYALIVEIKYGDDEIRN